MSYRQLVTPNPSVPCRPGWCLKYVADAYGGNFPQVYPSATAAWNAAQFKHQDQNFPTNIDVPVWFSVRGVPEGHVAIRMADGSVYSTTSSTATKAVRHPNMQDLINAYAPYNPLTYLGWTEDLAGKQLVINEGDTNMDTLKSMYWRLLGREGDAGGLQHYANQVQARGWEFVYNDLKDSGEGQADWAWRNPDAVRSLQNQFNQAKADLAAKDARIKELEYELANIPPCPQPVPPTPPTPEPYPHWFKEFWAKLIDAIKNILGDKK